MTRRIVPLTLLILLAIPSLSSAQAPKPPRISLHVEPQPIYQGQPFRLKINIESEGQKDPRVQLPRFSGFRVLQQHESHPSTFSFSFGFGGKTTNVRKKESNYTFVLVADKAGKHRIDPVMVTVDGRKYRGEAYQLEVLKGSGSGKGGQSLSPVDPGGVDQQGILPPDGKVLESIEGAKVQQDYFIQTAVSKKEVAVGEMLVLTIYLYMGQQLSNYDIIREPGTEGFWGENLIPGNRRRLTTETVIVGGKTYDRAALRKMALFPIKPGKLTIAPTLVELEVQPGMFFSRRKAVKRASLPVQITVRDLPVENQPQDFNPANVGRYAFRATVDNRSVKVGEPITLTLSAKGAGNVRNLVLPTPKEIDGIKSYAPESEVDLKPQGDSVTGTYMSRVLMIPEVPGEYTIPAISWSYFDPAATAYKTPSTKPIKIMVTQGRTRIETPSTAVPTKGQVTKVGQDRLNRQLRSILSRVDLNARRTGHPLTRPWFLLLAIGVPLLYIGFLLASRTRRKMKEAKGKNRSKYAESDALKTLSTLKKEQADKSSEDFFKALENCLLTFIENRLEEKAFGDTMAELRDRLLERGFSDEQVDRVVSETEACDFARFAKGAGQTEERKRAISRMEALIKELASVKLIPKKKGGKR